MTDVLPPAESVRVARRIHEVCQRFEAAWRGPDRPRLDDYLAAAEPERSLLLEELLALEVELRQAAGERPTEAEYRRAFPGEGDGSRIAAAFRRSADTEASGSARAPADDLSFLAPPGRPNSLGRLGQYEMLQVLGRGGFGIVFRAHDQGLDRVAAVKVLAPKVAASPLARKRFLREARSSAKVRHENVVHVYAVAEEPVPHLVMEYTPGETLQQRLDRAGPLDTAEVRRLGRQIAEGLAAAHAQGLIHRDIKPANILIEAGPPGRVRITDFGLARAADDASLTRSGVVAGTPLYMSPEQANGEKLDHRADLFSLGSVLYAMCTGRPPFADRGTTAVLRRVAEDTPRPVSEVAHEVPGWLSDLIARLHAKKPDDRIGTAREVADLLARGPDGALPAPPPAAPEVPAERPRSRRRWAAAAAVLLLLAAGLGVAEATGATRVRGTVVRLFSPEGTLVVEVDDPDVGVRVDGSDLVITGAGVKEIRLKTGEHTVEAHRTDGTLVARELVTVTKDGRQVVRVTREPPPKPAPPADDVAAWERSVAARPAGEQVTAVIARLKELNPGIDVKVEATTEKGVVTGLRVFQGGVTSIAPVRALSGLTDFQCAGTRVSDLSPLKGLKLNYLGAMNTPVSDLTPLRGMPLTQLDLHGARGVTSLKPLEGMALVYLNLTDLPVSDLSALKGMKSLRSLVLEGTPVSDLTPLRGLGLTDLKVKGTKVSDLDVIKDMPLKRLVLDYRADREGLLRSLKGLESINYKPAIEFWKEVEAQAGGPDRRAAGYVLSVGGTVRVDDQDRDLAAGKDLPPGPFRLSAVELRRNEQLTDAGLANFKDCRHLKVLGLHETKVGDEGLANFKDCKTLTHLWISGTRVTDGGLVVFRGCADLAELNLAHVKGVRGPGLANFKDCKKLTHLWLPESQVGDEGLAFFKDCTSLKSLNLSGAERITEAGLANFRNCKGLTLLDLHDMPVGDAGLANFKDCKAMEWLHLRNTRVTDTSLAVLQGFKNLTFLVLKDTQVTAGGIDGLKKALPKCKIEWDGGVIEPK